MIFLRGFGKKIHNLKVTRVTISTLQQYSYYIIYTSMVNVAVARKRLLFHCIKIKF